MRGDSSVTDLLTLSQVVLALQLAVCHVPPVAFHQFAQADGQMEERLVLLDRGLDERYSDHRDGHLWPAGFAEDCMASDRRWMKRRTLETDRTTMYDTILVTLDGTPTDRAIIEHVKKLAKLERTAAWYCCTWPTDGLLEPMAPMP